jgi:arylsulfatase A-like enzyme
LAGFFALLVLCGGAWEASAAERPNIVLVMADDQGWGDMAYQGHPHLKTPNFDRFAREGIHFDRFYAAAPVCSPTRGSVLTGRTPNRFGCFKWGYPLRPQEITLAEILQKAGYRTGHFGKWHLGSVQKASPVNPGASGFDVWVSSPNFFDRDPVLSVAGRAVPFEGDSSDITAGVALKFIRDCAKQKQPFLAVVWFGSPHLPHDALPSDRAAYADRPKREQNFLGEITAMDRAFGRVRDELKALGLRDNTILWYCSDNGGLPGVGSTGGRSHKGSIYEGGLRVPAILEWPAKLQSPQVVSSPCVTSDILPTVLELAGVEYHSRHPLDGISLAPILTGETSQRSAPIGFWDYPIRGIGTPSKQWMNDLLAAQKQGVEPNNPERLFPHAGEISKSYPADAFPGHAAWLDGTWKLHRIENKKGRVRYELYNLANDPMEKHDRYAQETQRAKKMRAELEAWLASVTRSLNGEDYAAEGN